MSEFLSLSDKIRDEMERRSREAFGGNSRKMVEYKAPTQSDLEEIKQALKYILEKLTQLDRYVRDHKGRPSQYEKNIYENEKDVTMKPLPTKEIE